MPGMILAELNYGGYISIAKLVPAIVLFYLWITLMNWVAKDTKEVQTKTNLWVSLIALAGVLSLAILMLVPLYSIGLILFIIALGTVSIVYIIHRNSLVADFEKIFTAAYFKTMFSNEEKKIEKASKGFTLITANGNPVDLPTPKSKESFGFKTACQLLDDAIFRRAEIVTLLPSQAEYNIAYTIDGVVTKVDPRTKEEIDYFIFYLKHLADLEVNEKRKPQKGSFQCRKDGKNIEWQVKTAGSTAGEQIILRRIVEFSEMKIDKVGLSEKQLEQIKTLKEVKQGIFLIAGPKGSGVTTALYAFLKNHDPFLNSINTLEKKPAAEIESITQNTFTMSDTGTTTFDKRLQSILRFGPDIVGVGDCDDSKTAIVANTWGAKRLLYVTLEAKSSIEALAKWIKLVGDKKSATENLIGIASTRLFRELCDECREAYQPNPETLRKLNIPANKVELLYRPGEVQYTRGGKPILCEKCQGTGYFGRTCIFESVLVTESMREAIKDAKTMQEILSILRKGGMSLMQEQAIKRVAQGEISVNEMVRELKSATKSSAAKK